MSDIGSNETRELISSDQVEGTSVYDRNGITAKKQNRRNGMSDDLTNDQIALLCDIGEFKHLNLTVERKRDLEHLISIGYVIPSESPTGSAYMLTPEAHEFLGMRGATLNEA